MHLQEAVAVTTAIQEEIFLEMGIGKFVLAGGKVEYLSFCQMKNLGTQTMHLAFFLD